MNVSPFLLPRIRCAVCDKLVDEVRARNDVMTMALVFEVSCHGDIDTCEIPASFLEEVGLVNLEEGTAFGTKRVRAGRALA